MRGKRSSESCKANHYILLANEYPRGECETIAGWEGSLSSSPNSGSHGNSGRLTSSSDCLSYILVEHTPEEEEHKAVNREIKLNKWRIANHSHLKTIPRCCHGNQALDPG